MPGKKKLNFGEETADELTSLVTPATIHSGLCGKAGTAGLHEAEAWTPAAPGHSQE